MVDHGEYAAAVAANTAAAASAAVESPEESLNSYTMGLQFNRLMTLHGGSSQFTVEQRLINNASQAVTWGVWGITQSSVTRGGVVDHENIWAYFPKGTTSRIIGILVG